MDTVPAGGYTIGGEPDNDGGGSDGSDLGPRKFFCDDTWNDNLHPCDAGFAAIAEEVRAAIKGDATADVSGACLLQ